MYLDSVRSGHSAWDQCILSLPVSPWNESIPQSIPYFTVGFTWYQNSLNVSIVVTVFSLWISSSITGFTNYLFDALVSISDIRVPEITCQFLNGPVSSASCEVNYGTSQNYMNLTSSASANDTNTTAVTLQLTQLQPNTEYYYIVLVVGDSMRARIRGTFVTGMYPLHCSLAWVTWHS